MCECWRYFEPNFLDKVDKNPYLLNFKNGVIDIQDKYLEKQLDDYLSLSTHINYVPLDNSKEQVKIQNEIRTFANNYFRLRNCMIMCGIIYLILLLGTIKIRHLIFILV